MGWMAKRDAVSAEVAIDSRRQRRHSHVKRALTRAWRLTFTT